MVPVTGADPVEIFRSAPPFDVGITTVTSFNPAATIGPGIESFTLSALRALQIPQTPTENDSAKARESPGRLQPHEPAAAISGS
jgi:hypothetical protein